MYAVGVDLGGTNIKAGLVDNDGKMIEYMYSSTSVERGAEEVLKRILEIIDTLLVYSRRNHLDIGGIGLITPGVVDPEFGGVTGGAYNIPGWMGTPFMKLLFEKFKIPVFAHNDVTGTVLAEYLYGAGRGFKNIVMATFGTGIGGGIVINGELYDGATGYAGEIGHMVIRVDGYKCTCGIKGCWEEYASVRGMVRTAKIIIDKAESSVLSGSSLSDNRDIDPEIIFKEAVKGDKLALLIVDRICRDVAVGVGSLINIFNPEVFIIGGGVAKAGKIFLDGILSHLKDFTLPDSRKAVKLKLAELGYESGIVGAASLVFKNINRYKG